jgi:Tfp pilus assembly protein PilO
LSAIAKTSEVELTSITPAAPVVGTTDNALPLAVSVNGHYFAIQRFLRLLRASADLRNGKLVGNGRLYSVDSIGFAGSAGVITASIAINAYQNLGAAAIAAAAAATAATAATTTTTATSTTPASASGTAATDQ